MCLGKGNSKGFQLHISFFFLYMRHYMRYRRSNLFATKPTLLPIHLKLKLTHLEVHSLNPHLYFDPWLPSTAGYALRKHRGQDSACHNEITTEVQEQRQPAGTELEGHRAQQRARRAAGGSQSGRGWKGPLQVSSGRASQASCCTATGRHSSTSGFNFLSQI